jgi:NAD(P)-dependent dehydrogenase (short-subunit alcohol dehydrogenase family)
MKKTLVAAALGLAAFDIATKKRRRAQAAGLAGKVVLITGGSRGLGLAIADEFARHGCRLVICARDADQLERARARLQAAGADVLAQPCDVRDRTAIEALLAAATRRFGQVDILVNNAGIISVGPLAAQTPADFEDAMDVMFWGAFWPTMAVLDGMRTRGYGRIVNITSVGGKVAVPHLLPYAAAKFATVGFSEGLRSELAGSGVEVTTVVPGLMRTGSHLNAEFRGKPRGEFTWFSVLGNLPLTSISGRSAAQRIVEAARLGEPEVTLGVAAQLAARAQGLAPGMTAAALGLVNCALPRDPGPADRRISAGWESQTAVTDSFLTALGRRAGREFLQYPALKPVNRDEPGAARGLAG